jgi:hypothetical protein
MSTIAGNGSEGSCGDGGQAVNACLTPTGLTFDKDGNLFIADGYNDRVRKVTPAGAISTVAGGGGWGYCGDNGPAVRACLSNPLGLAVDGAGNLYIADNGNKRVRRVTTDGVIRTVAGNGEDGSCGDDVATQVCLGPAGLALEKSGDLLITDTSGYRLRRLSPAGTLTTAAGTGVNELCGDGGPAVQACLVEPNTVAVDDSGAIYLDDYLTGRVRRIDPAGVITTVAGAGVWDFCGDGGPALNACFRGPVAVATGPGVLYVSDSYNHRIRKVTW